MNEHKKTDDIILDDIIETDEEEMDKTHLPVIVIREFMPFPGAMMSFDINRPQSLAALDAALEIGCDVLLVGQRDRDLENPTSADLCHMGVITSILQVLRLPMSGMARVITHGDNRGVVVEYLGEDPYITAHVEGLYDAEPDTYTKDAKALMRLAFDNFTQCMEMQGKNAPESITRISEEMPGRLADIIASNIRMKPEQAQELLEELDVMERLRKVVGILTYELELLKIQRGLFDKVRANVDKNQRDYILREQLKAIHTELGDADNVDDDVQSYRKKLEELPIPAAVKDKLNQEIKRLKQSGFSAEASVQRDYIERVLALPWGVKSKENTNLIHAEEVLEKDHYGLTKVKERVMEFLAVRQTASDLDAPILCLVGPPGVGKTSVAKSVARALDRKYVRMSLGGVRDEAEIRGHRKTYVGAMPGRIMEAVNQSGTMNPLILLDEIDKMTSDFRGDPGSALLEVLDAEQNSGFRDHYIEIPFNLSDVLFICTANQTDTIPPALRDRLEMIPLNSYSENEKLHIAIEFLIPKQLKKHGLKKSQVKMQPAVIEDIIRLYTREAGVRQLERMMAQIYRKVVKILLTEGCKSITVNKDNLEKFLGKLKFRKDTKDDKPEVGVCRGLAWTSVGGDTLSIEVNTIKGSGKFKLTGNIGKVMEESAHAAMSYIRSRHEQLSIRKGFFKDTDIHIHIPEGATPKDGPSAGITMATAMISALTDIPVSNQVAMTGEITIRGRVLPIGGLKEKILAAKNAGIHKVLLPLENESDLSEINQEIKEGLDFILVKTMDEVLSHALER
ncbi:MAG: endopeptidase La [Clostridiales bacterium]|jgi:ATP-dependent Lon protease|nr:endopeptidase La [Clostridiales bacterium]